MAVIKIRDLADSVELDRQAMNTIIGGARDGLRPSFRIRPASNTNRVVNYPGVPVNWTCRRSSPDRSRRRSSRRNSVHESEGLPPSLPQWRTGMPVPVEPPPIEGPAEVPSERAVRLTRARRTHASKSPR